VGDAFIARATGSRQRISTGGGTTAGSFGSSMITLSAEHVMPAEQEFEARFWKALKSDMTMMIA
jgi:hypothetical protein